jgi:hypothetical protein
MEAYPVHKRLLRVMVSAWAVLITAVTQGSPALAEPATGTGQAYRPAASAVDQSRQEALWEDILNYVDKGKVSGFAGGSFASDGRTVNIYWTGNPPATLTTLAARHNTAALMSVTEVAYSKQEFVARARTLFASARQAGIPVMSVGRTADFIGTRVEVEDAVTAAERKLLNELGATEIVEGSGATLQLSRTNDPWQQGGAVITDRADAACSSGWAVRKPNGTRGMITAQHCGPNREWWSFGNPPAGNGQNGPWFGESNAGDDLTDSMVISDDSLYEPYTPNTYWGPWNNDSAVTNQHAADPPLGSYICAEGGMSGEACGARVEEVDVIGPEGAGPGFWARRSDGGAVGGIGDSGSPALDLGPNGNGPVILRGMLDSTSIIHPADCDHTNNNPWYEYKLRHCYGRIFFVYQSAVNAANGVTPIVSG